MCICAYYAAGREKTNLHRGGGAGRPPVRVLQRAEGRAGRHPTLRRNVTAERLAGDAVLPPDGGTDRTTLTRNLRPLEKQGLLRVEPGADRRERKVTLTARGERTMAEALPLWEAAQARVTNSFGQERLRRLFAELAALAAAGRAA
jgi:DNA-binding HxlR family transcriptional regulator